MIFLFFLFQKRNRESNALKNRRSFVSQSQAIVAEQRIFHKFLRKKEQGYPNKFCNPQANKRTDLLQVALRFLNFERTFNLILGSAASTCD